MKVRETVNLSEKPESVSCRYVTVLRPDVVGDPLPDRSFGRLSEVKGCQRWKVASGCLRELLSDYLPEGIQGFVS
jgi:hypothetical protein